MRQALMIGLTSLALLGTAAPSATAQTPDAGRTVDAPLVSLWGTGPGLDVYHNIFADCDTILHGHGRNAAWGSWTMPRRAVAIDVIPAAASEAAAVLIFRCLDGSPCIEERLRTNRTLSEHRVAISARERADGFAREMAEIDAGCSGGR